MRIEEILAKALEKVGNDRYILALDCRSKS